MASSWWGWAPGPYAARVSAWTTPKGWSPGATEVHREPDLRGAAQQEAEAGEDRDRAGRRGEVEQQDQGREQREDAHGDVPAPVLARAGGDEEVVDPDEQEPQQQADDEDHDAGHRPEDHEDAGERRDDPEDH